MMLLDYENVEESLSGVTEVIDKFPKLKQVFKGFVATDRNCLMATFEDGSVGFNRRVYGTKESLASEIEWVITEGRGINNFSAKSIGYHEAGHLIEMYLCHNQANNEANAISLYNSRAIASNIIESAIKSLKIEYNRNIVQELAAQISDPATENDSELLAECIADYMTNKTNAHELSKAVWTQIRGK